jgi:hypothetical protein
LVSLLFAFVSLCSLSFFTFCAAVVASVAKKDYFLGFFFWLDLTATISLVFDVPYLYEGAPVG